MGMRKGVPHAKCSPLCAIKEKLQALWDRTYGCINKINDITPDGDGKFSIQAGSNIQLTEISNGLKIDTTGGVTYYTTTDPKLDIDNDALTIETVGVASQDDLDTVAGGVTTNANAISDIVNGTTTVGSAALIVSNTYTVGSDTKPVKIVNGQPVAVTNDLMVDDRSISAVTVNGMTIYLERKGNILNIVMQNATPAATGDFLITEATTTGLGLVPVLGGDSNIKGYLYGDGTKVWIRTVIVDNTGHGFRATYFMSV